MIWQAKVGGAFFRGLRLAVELSRRGWSAILCNQGPIMDDPKVQQARDRIRILNLEAELPKPTAAEARRFFESFDPDVIVFGEGPIGGMKVIYNGARATRCHLVMLDQYYWREMVGPRRDVDLLLLSGLKSFWGEDLRLFPWEEIVPPYIDAVTPPAQLPVDRQLPDLPWVLLVAYDELVLDKGLELLASAGIEAVLIVVSCDTEMARRLAAGAAIDLGRVVTLPLLGDADVYGLMGASRVVIVANGFLQIMAALAMGSPVICIDRGLGISAFNIASRFYPYVSIGEDAEKQRDRLRQWLQESPLPLPLLEALSRERNGTRISADLIERTIARPRRWLARLLRLGVRFGVDINALLINHYLTGRWRG
jgi:hypothetical protein